MDQLTNATNLTETARFIADLSFRAANAEHKASTEPTIIDLYGRKYHFLDGRLQEIKLPEPFTEYAPETFRAFTLDGLIDWIKADTDKLFVPENPAALVVVDSPTRVRVFSHALGERKERACYATCDYAAPSIQFSKYLDSEELFINIQTCFLQDGNRDIVLRIVNNMTEEQTVQVSDDGLSQRVNIQSGLQEVDKTIFKNPAYLRPMRTFTEVPQPQSAFIVRFKEGKQAALFEADGGKWKVEAVRNIGKYLREQLAEQNVVVIA